MQGLQAKVQAWVQGIPSWIYIVLAGLALAIMWITDGDLGVLVEQAPLIGLLLVVGAGAAAAGMIYRNAHQAQKQEALNTDLAESAIVRIVLPARDGTWRREVRAGSINLFAQISSILAQSEDHVALEIIATEAGVYLALWGREETLTQISLAIRGAFPAAMVVADAQQDDLLNALPDTVVYATAKLAQAAAWPVADVNEMGSDPLQTLLATLYQEPEMDPIGLQLIVRQPQSDRWRKRAQAEIRQINTVTQQKRGAMAASDRNRVKVLGNKADGLTGLEATVRVFAGAGSKHRLPAIIRTVSSISRSPYNSLTFGTPAEDDGAVVRQRHFDHKAGQKTVLSADELALLFHIPGGDVAAAGLRRARGKLLPAPIAATEEGYGPYRVLGKGYLPTGAKPFVAWRYGFDTKVHGYVVGPTGSGKSTLLANVAGQDLLYHGVWVLEPHASLIRDVLDRVPPWRESDVIWVNPTHTTRSYGVNLMACPSPELRDSVASTFMGILARILEGEWERAVRMRRLLRNAVLALLEGADDTPTMMNLYFFLKSPGYREEIVSSVTNPTVSSFWMDEFEAWGASEQNSATQPPLTRIEQFLSNAMVRHVMSQPTTTLDFRACMDDQKIILMDLSAKDERVGAENANVLGTAAMALLWGAATSRRDLLEQHVEPTQFYGFVDEFQNYVDETFEEILAEARKFGLGLVLANQFFGQLPNSMQSAIKSNCRTKVAFAVESPDEAKLLASIFGLERDDAMTLEQYHAFVRMSMDKQATDTFTIQTLPPLDMADYAHRERATAASSREIPDDRMDADEKAAWQRHMTGMGVKPIQYLLGTDDARADFAMVSQCADYLSGLDDQERQRFTRLREKADAMLLRALADNPGIISDKATRIRAMSALQVMTPRAEIDAKNQQLRERVQGDQSGLADLLF
jgi:hypothetical protein